MSPEPSTGPGTVRRATAVSGVLPRTHKVCCPGCDNSVTGTHLGQRAIFCISHDVLDRHAEEERLYAPRRLLYSPDAWNVCRGKFSIPRDKPQDFPPVVHHPNIHQVRCEFCSTMFIRVRKDQRYCSSTCRDAAQRQRRRDRR